MTQRENRIIVIRFSALGDIAMSIPVLCSVAKAYPQTEIVFVTNKIIKPLEQFLPKNIRIYAVDKKGAHKGIKGLNRIIGELKREKAMYVADIHDVLRSKYIRAALRMMGAKTAVIDKERGEKRRLVKKGYQKYHQLKSTIERYNTVFEKLGFKYDLRDRAIEIPETTVQELNLGTKEGEKWIGIAPFAQHKGKIYPTDMMEKVIEILTRSGRYRVFLFGGGKSEMEQFEDWNKRYDNIEIAAGRYDMAHELALMSKLDVMLSMDSANMHLASLAGTKVISIWGATHRYAGFLGWNNSEDRVIESALPCRPCSIYGNKECKFGDYRCMREIKPERVAERIEDEIE